MSHDTVNPYLDLAIVAPATAGPRTLELSPREWAAIAQTARGDAVELEVASLESAAPATKRATATRLKLADLAPSAVLAGGIAGVTGQVTDANLPGLWRYDVRAGAAAPLLANPDGACIGCHLAVSADGARIAALIVTPTSSNADQLALSRRRARVRMS